MFEEDTRTKALRALMMFRQHIGYLKLICEPLSKLDAQDLEAIEALLNVQRQDLEKLWREFRTELQRR